MSLAVATQDRRADREGAASRARGRHRAPRSQAAERLPRALGRRRGREGPRFRRRQDVRVEDDGEATRTGSVLGSPKYMSPEQARGLKSVDHRSDLWSFGVILYRAVTGRTPFNGESIGDLIVKICSDPIPRPSELVPGLSPAVDAFFAARSRPRSRAALSRPRPISSELSVARRRIDGCIAQRGLDVARRSERRRASAAERFPVRLERGTSVELGVVVDVARERFGVGGVRVGGLRVRLDGGKHRHSVEREQLARSAAREGRSSPLAPRGSRDRHLRRARDDRLSHPSLVAFAEQIGLAIGGTAERDLDRDRRCAGYRRFRERRRRRAERCPVGRSERRIDCDGDCCAERCSFSIGRSAGRTNESDGGAEIRAAARQKEKPMGLLSH